MQQPHPTNQTTQQKHKWIGAWIIVHIVAVLAAMLAVFLLYVLLQVNRYSDSSAWVPLLGRLAIVGGLAGSIAGGLQAGLLWWMRSRVRFWMAGTIGAMALGMVMPVAIALAVGQDFNTTGTFDLYWGGGLFLSWILAGLVQGVLVGKARSQAVRIGLVNAGAGLFSAVAIAFSLLFLAALLDRTSFTVPVLLGWIVLIGINLLLSAAFNAYVALALIRHPLPSS